MEVTAPDGTDWVAYIEGVPPEPQGLFGSRTVLPGRRLRFDSADRSRTTGRVPAGAPFLSEPRLVELLRESAPFPPPPEPAPVPAQVRLWHSLNGIIVPWARRIRARLVREAERLEPMWEEAGVRIHHGLETLVVGARRVFR